MVKKTIYLDYAAATPVASKVLSAMTPYFSDKFYNPSANYLTAKDVSAQIEKSRSSVAQIIGARSSEIIFTSGGTEANNLAIKGVLEKFPGSNVVVSAIEHESILAPAEDYKHKIARVNSDGLIDLEKLKSLIDDKTVLVSIIYVSNEIGTIQPLRKISKIIKDIRLKRLASRNKLPIYFHSDACQAPAYLDIHVSGLGLDLMSLNGGKIYGPKQSGILFIKRDVMIKPQILGGGQEMNLRSGTENVPSVIGFSKALELAQSNKQKESIRMSGLQNLFVDELCHKVKNVRINGSIKMRIPSNVNITIPGQDNETMLMKLDEHGIMCASGSACNARSGSASHVLLAIGLSEAEAKSSLRFSMGQHTTELEIKYCVRVINEII